MKRFTTLAIVAFISLAAFACITGCTGSSQSGSSSGQPAPVTTVPVTPLYSAGDIVKNPSSGATMAVLIIRYDAATDIYERAYIYPNPDGSWGYRLDSNTVTVSRANIEKLYPKKISTVTVSSIPISAPTTVPAATGVTTLATAVPMVVTTTTATTTATTAPTGLAPRISDIVPSKGTAGTTVSITALEGQNFVSGANVSLVKDSSKIQATSVVVSSSGVITCSFAIPSGSASGYWDVLITNPDKQYYQYKTAFYVVEGGSAVTTTTTTSAVGADSTTVPSFKATTVSSASPSSGYVGTPSVQVIVSGSNFAYVTNIVLTSGTKRIPAINSVPGDAPLTSKLATFDLSTASAGTYYIQALDSDGAVVGTSQTAIFTIY
jgi:hypothetical protein